MSILGAAITMKSEKSEQQDLTASCWEADGLFTKGGGKGDKDDLAVEEHLPIFYSRDKTPYLLGKPQLHMFRPTFDPEITGIPACHVSS